VAKHEPTRNGGEEGKGGAVCCLFFCVYTHLCVSLFVHIHRAFSDCLCLLACLGCDVNVCELFDLKVFSKVCFSRRVRACLFLLLYRSWPVHAQESEMNSEWCMQKLDYIQKISRSITQPRMIHMAYENENDDDRIPSFPSSFLASFGPSFLRSFDRIVPCCVPC